MKSSVPKSRKQQNINQSYLNISMISRNSTNSNHSQSVSNSLPISGANSLPLQTIKSE